MPTKRMRTHYGTKISKTKSLEYFQEMADELNQQARDWMAERCRKFKIKYIHCTCHTIIGRDTVRVMFHFYHHSLDVRTLGAFYKWAHDTFPYEVIKSDMNPNMIHVFLLGPSTKSMYW